MLVLTRRAGESIMIDDDIELKVLKIRGSQVHLGIDAPLLLEDFSNDFCLGAVRSNGNDCLFGADAATNDSPIRAFFARQFHPEVDAIGN